jgi:EAL domain-containing protein (putative c-di-GMP-specific phosphodiesterase class I)
MKNILGALGIEDIQIYFQPIVSLQKFHVIGVEALCRGINKGKIVPPAHLFSLAEELEISLEFDRLCRQRALFHFKTLQQKHKDLLLFLNHDPSLLDQKGTIHGYTWELVRNLSLPPNCVILEICESKVSNMDALVKFVSDYKKRGFLFALDDVGAQHSNLNRIPQLKPDILKMDRDLIRNADKVWHKNKILKSISYLAREIRSLVIAEGVETKEEIMEMLEIGIELFQGFYFAKPAPPVQLKFELSANNAKRIGTYFRDLMIDKFQKRRNNFQHFSEVIMYIASRLRKIEQNNFQDCLKELIQNYQEIECAYILNEHGIQITDTIFYNNKNSKSICHLFSPAQKGDNLSSRDYFYSLIYCDSIYYVSEPYLSRATGHKCITISTLFEKNNKKFILCIDILINDLKKTIPNSKCQI